MAEVYLINLVNERVIPLVEALNAEFLPEVAISRVIKINAQLPTFPYWSVFPVPPGRDGYLSRSGLGYGDVVHVIGLRLWFARASSGRDGGADHLSWLNWVCYPTTVRYFQARPSLCIDDTQEDADHLDTSKTTFDLASDIGPLPINQDPESPAILGMDFHLSVTFNFPTIIR